MTDIQQYNASRTQILLITASVDQVKYSLFFLINIRGEIDIPKPSHLHSLVNMKSEESKHFKVVILYFSKLENVRAIKASSLAIMIWVRKLQNKLSLILYHVPF